MSWEDRPYNEPPKQSDGTWQKILRALNWSFDIGTYLDVRVRVHISFVIVAVLFLLTSDDWWFTLQWQALLFLSVLLHEFGHILGCRSVGGRANEILMWPLGGLAYCSPPRKPWPEFVTVAWGPMVNVILAGIAVLVLWIGWGTPFPMSFNPFEPGVLDTGNALQVMFALLFVVNYFLLLFNLALVFYPFDGGRLVQIALWKKLGYRKSMKIATRVGMVGAVFVGLIGLVSQRLMLTMIAVFGFMACYQTAFIMKKQEEYGGNIQIQGAADGIVPAWDEDEDYVEAKPGPIARWRARRAAKKEQAERDAEAAFDAEVDRILIKVKEEGMQSLTEKEKDTLKRETDRKQVG